MSWIVECVVCETKFEAERSHARYCSGACKQRAWRQERLYNVIDDNGDDLPKLLEEAAQMLKEGRSPQRKLKRIAKLSDKVSVNDWLVRNGHG